MSWLPTRAGGRRRGPATGTSELDDSLLDSMPEDTIAARMAAGVALIRASDGVMVWVNDAWETMLGYLPGELVGRHVSVVNAPSEQAPEERAREIADALKRDGAWRGDVHHVRKDGTRFWSQTTVSRFEHPSRGTFWIAVHADVTARKAAEGALRDAEERLRGVFKAAPVGIVLVGTDLRMSDVNPAFCRMTGYRHDELVDRSMAEITHPADIDLDTVLARQVFSGEIPSYRVEKRLITKSDRVVPAELTATIVRGPDGRPLHGLVFIDVIGA
jgi:PAS domain S-box-containing protein